MISVKRLLNNWALGPVSRKPRNFSGVFRVTQFSLYLQNEGVSRHETLQLFLFLFPLQQVKRSALQNKQVVILRMAYRARKVLGTFEKRAPGLDFDLLGVSVPVWESHLATTRFKCGHSGSVGSNISATLS